jgi:hypothetical protein
VKVTVLCTVVENDLDAAEIEWIARKNTLVPNGYNLTLGGDAQPMDNPVVAAWQKQQIGEAMRRPEVRQKKRELWQDEQYRRMQFEQRTGSDDWMQARKDCQNTLESNEKRRATWARKRAVKVAAMGVEEGREFMKMAMKHALRLANVAASRIDPVYGRDPVKETRIFWEREIAGYEATLWQLTQASARSLPASTSTSTHLGEYESDCHE